MGRIDLLQEPEVVEYCNHCGAELYEWDEVITDSCYHYCDLECARKFHGIEEVEDFADGRVCCSQCGEVLDPTNITYKNDYEEDFCSLDCADSMSNFEWYTL